MFRRKEKKIANYEFLLQIYLLITLIFKIAL
jgi:hypothetical protein